MRREQSGQLCPGTSKEAWLGYIDADAIARDSRSAQGYRPPVSCVSRHDRLPGPPTIVEKAGQEQLGSVHGVRMLYEPTAGRLECADLAPSDRIGDAQHLWWGEVRSTALWGPEQRFRFRPAFRPKVPIRAPCQRPPFVPTRRNRRGSVTTCPCWRPASSPGVGSDQSAPLSWHGRHGGVASVNNQCGGPLTIRGSSWM